MALAGLNGFLKKGNIQVFSSKTLHAQSVKENPLAVMAPNGIGGLWIAVLPLKEGENLYFNHSQLGRKGKEQL